MAKPCPADGNERPAMYGPQSRRYALVALLLVPLGVATKFYAGPGEHWVRTAAGGLLYVMFFSFVLLGLRPALAPWRAAGLVLALTCLLEIAQLWQPGWLMAVRSTWLGHALLGSVFAWPDFLHYALGAALAAGLATCLRPARHRA